MNSLDILLTQDDQFKENYPKIMKKISKKKLEEMEPTIDEITKVTEIIIEYIKQNKRKVYGGYCLNKLLLAKNPSFAIYDELDTPDIEFYSPDPLGDLTKLCDKLADEGFKNVIGQEAQHKETYSIFVNYQLYCDISYMPSNIYSKVRFIQMDGFNLIHPWFMTIDYFRMFTDPLVSYWRLEKHFARYLKLQKTYPLPLINKPIMIDEFINNELHSTINLLEDYLSTLQSVIFTGFYVYNYYLHFTSYTNKDKRFKQIQMPYLEVYTTSYIKDGLDILEYLKSLDCGDKISHKEFYPFFQFYGYNTVFYFEMNGENIPILYLYSNNNKCISYKNVSYVKFDNITLKSSIIKNKTINIGSFDFNILHALIILVKIRIDEDDDWNEILYTLINGFVNFRKYYFEKNNKTLYDNSIFEGFVVECKGETITPDREKRLMIQVRKKLGKPAIYRYEPKSTIQNKHNTYYFANSSGNEIKNNKYIKLKKENLNKKLEDELELLTDEKNISIDEIETDV